MHMSAAALQGPVLGRIGWNLTLYGMVDVAGARWR
jgi:hypothetical protein